jgi:hypothetical protein
LEILLRQLPSQGMLFPYWGQMTANDRAAEFRRRCKILKIEGVSLHSYRYAWAERAFSNGYPERFAQAALGHSSKAIHAAYARRAKVICPSMEDYETKVLPLPIQASQGVGEVHSEPATECPPANTSTNKNEITATSSARVAVHEATATR